VLNSQPAGAPPNPVLIN